MRTIIWVIAVAAVSGVACEPIPANDVSVFEDLGAPKLDLGTNVVSDTGGVDAMQTGQATPDLPGRECQMDGDCASPSWCDDDGRCAQPVEEPLVSPLMDGMTRAGVAGFDLVPEHFEPWHERASDECPDNRPGYFDGELDISKPDDPCLDAFDDLNGNGHFDAAWLGGPDLDRSAMDVDDGNPPQGRVVVLTRDDLVIVLLSFDIYALDRGQVETLTTQLSVRLGLPSEAFVVHTTGNRSGPDAMGLSGPSWRTVRQKWQRDWPAQDPHSLNVLMELPVHSGVQPTWWDSFVRRASAAVRRASRMTQTVRVRQALARLPIGQTKFGAGAVPMDAEEADGFSHDESGLERWRARLWPLVRDEHIPGKLDDAVHVISLDSMQSDGPHIILAGWGAAPAMNARENTLSADYPGYIRKGLEALYPGATAVWLTSAASDTHVADARVFVPDVDAAGNLLDQDGEQTDNPQLARASSDRLGAMARLITQRLAAALDDAEAQPAELGYEARSVWVPVGNPRVALAASLGLLPRQQGWFSGHAPTNVWVSRDFAPACGGLGCLRYRLDRIQFAPDTTLVTAPGAFDQSYVLGRRGLTIHYRNGRNYQDLDGDGSTDHEDDDGIVVSARIGRESRSFEVEQAVNPQTFDPIIGLGDESNWLVGRTNGGWGSFRSASERVNVFEGQMNDLLRLASGPETGNIRLSELGYPVRGDLTFALVAERLMMVAPQLLADLITSHELVCGVEMPEADAPVRWVLQDGEGALLAEGEDLILGPGAKVFSPSVNFGLLRIPSGAQLFLPDMRDMAWGVEGVVPLTLRDHPNATDAWSSTASAGGDYIYNGLCELIATDGVCQTTRTIRRDPNPQLPRMRRSYP